MEAPNDNQLLHELQSDLKKALSDLREIREHLGLLDDSELTPLNAERLDTAMRAYMEKYFQGYTNDVEHYHQELVNIDGNAHYHGNKGNLEWNIANQVDIVIPTMEKLRSIMKANDAKIKQLVQGVIDSAARGDEDAKRRIDYYEHFLPVMFMRDMA